MGGMSLKQVTKIVENSSPLMHWYALKVFYNKVFDIEEELTKDKIETYIPCETVIVEHHGGKKSMRKPVISSLLFFCSTEKQALEQQQKLTDRVILYTRVDGWKKLPIAIPEREMNIFMLVTSSGEKGLEYFGNAPVEYTTGEHVKVTDGPFKGAEGYIRRIKGNRRLIVSIQGVCAVATTYIPQCFLQKI